jgi:hypothetical protein
VPPPVIAGTARNVPAAAPVPAGLVMLQEILVFYGVAAPMIYAVPIFLTAPAAAATGKTVNIVTFLTGHAIPVATRICARNVTETETVLFAPAENMRPVVTANVMTRELNNAAGTPKMGIYVT